MGRFQHHGDEGESGVSFRFNDDGSLIVGTDRKGAHGTSYVLPAEERQRLIEFLTAGPQPDPQPGPGA